MASSAALASDLVLSVVALMASGVVSNSGRPRTFLNFTPSRWKSANDFALVAGLGEGLEQAVTMQTRASGQQSFNRIRLKACEGGNIQASRFAAAGALPARIQEIEAARNSCRFTVKIHGDVRSSETPVFPG